MESRAGLCARRSEVGTEADPTSALPPAEHQTPETGIAERED
ncbi:MAG: hypothetical protein P8X80_22175 [Desulfobacterales bacterium]